MTQTDDALSRLRAAMTARTDVVELAYLRELPARQPRSTTRRLLAAGAVTAAVAGIGAALLFSDDGGTRAVTRMGPATAEVAGVSFIVPDGWHATPLPAAESTVGSCLSSAADGTAVSCNGVEVLVADPAGSYDVGVASLTRAYQACGAGAARLLDEQSAIIGGLPASMRTFRCRQTDNPTVIWALDNQSVAVVADEPAERAIASSIVRSLTFPATITSLETPSPATGSNTPSPPPTTTSR